MLHRARGAAAHQKLLVAEGRKLLLLLLGKEALLLLLHHGEVLRIGHHGKTGRAHLLLHPWWHGTSWEAWHAWHTWHAWDTDSGGEACHVWGTGELGDGVGGERVHGLHSAKIASRACVLLCVVVYGPGGWRSGPMLAEGGWRGKGCARGFQGPEDTGLDGCGMGMGVDDGGRGDCRRQRNKDKEVDENWILPSGYIRKRDYTRMFRPYYKSPNPPTSRLSSPPHFASAH